MHFEPITEADFRTFSETSPYKSFMQTPEIAKLREQSGWTVYYLAVKDEKDKIMAATMLVAKPTLLGKSTFLAPGGPLLDLENKPLATYFLKNLKLFAKTHNAHTLQISPYYETVERDRNGEKVENGFDHTSVKSLLNAQGFKEIESTQPKFMFALDLKNRTETELLADFKRNTRNHIKKAEKQGVLVREIKKDELDKFKKITESTAERRGFTDRTIDYFESMYDLFAPRNEVKFLLAEAKIEGKTTVLSAAMFMLTGDEIVYLFSGSDERYMRDYNAQYAIQWYMLKYATKNHFRRYNFYGISGLPDKSSKDYGIYDFKKGFGGAVLEYLGTYSAPVSLLGRLKSLLKS